MQNKEHHTMKRTDYINWDEYFMGIALLTAMRSKDPCLLYTSPSPRD
mgnify:CR=1 FL=1